MPEPAPLVVFSDDWGRHPSSCQHLIRHLLPRRRVTWVNTIGTRPPRIDWLTAKRGFGKLRQWVGLGRTQGANDGVGSLPHGRGSPEPTVLNPKMWPSFRSRFARGLNRRLLARALRPMTESGTAPVIITTLPVVVDLVGSVRAARWVYYCVDDFSVWPGLDGRTLQGLEAELVPRVDVAVAVSETLQTHLAKLGKPSHLLTHGIDPEFWQCGAAPASLPELDGLARPLVVFWGVIDRRMDSSWLESLANKMSDGTILLVGPQDHPDPALLRHPRVRVLPALPFAELPALAAQAAVLIAPYADLPVTRAMQPLKFKEYLATGLPAVVRKLPATASWADCADVVESPDEFASAVLARLRDCLPEGQRTARSRLQAERWASKAAQFEKWLDGME
jgi:hypothetical protein